MLLLNLLVGTRLDLSPADHSQNDGQTESFNRVVEYILRSVCTETPKRWSSILLVVEFGLNNSVHVSTGYIFCYMNSFTHPRAPLTLPRGGIGLGGGDDADRLADVSPASVKKLVSEFFAMRLNFLRHVRDAMADSRERKREQAITQVGNCIESCKVAY